MKNILKSNRQMHAPLTQARRNVSRTSEIFILNVYYTYYYNYHIANVATRQNDQQIFIKNQIKKYVEFHLKIKNITNEQIIKKIQIECTYVIITRCKKGKSINKQ